MLADGFTDIEHYILLLKYGAYAAIFTAIIVVIGGIYLIVRISRVEDRAFHAETMLDELQARMLAEARSADEPEPYLMAPPYARPHSAPPGRSTGE